MGKIDWKKTLRWNEEHFEDLRFAGYSYIRQGKYEIALPFFQALNILNPENAYDAQTLGALYLQLRQPEKALKYLNQALKLEADHAPTLLNLTKALLMLGKKEEALKLAHILTREKNPHISQIAQAILLAYE